MNGQTCCVELLSLGQLSNLEQLEGPWLALMASGEPEAVATALRLFHSHLQWTMQQMQRAMVTLRLSRALGCTIPQPLHRRFDLLLRLLADTHPTDIDKSVFARSADAFGHIDQLDLTDAGFSPDVSLQQVSH